MTASAPTGGLRLLLCGELAGRLPARLRTELGRYDSISPLGDTMEAREFAAYHSACKAALAHMEAMVKLAALAEPPASAAPGAPAVPEFDAAALARQAAEAVAPLLDDLQEDEEDD
ncbi:hypothetical protein FACS1894186_3250 [Alphaproteobacteria bacterium]|nr:hypothetical protein FACS1894186_3250 [Alphaproteobacteria bacterium]